MSDDPGIGPCVHRFEVRLHDTDAAGRLFYAHLFRHAHDAYESLLADLGLPLRTLIAGAAGRAPIALPIIRAEAEYLAPIGLGERIAVPVAVSELRRRSFALDYRFEDSSGQVRARAQTVHCLAAKDSALPPDLARALLTRLAGAPGTGYAP